MEKSHIYIIYRTVYRTVYSEINLPKTEKSMDVHRIFLIEGMCLAQSC